MLRNSLLALGIYSLPGAVAIALFFLGVTPVMYDFWSVRGSRTAPVGMTDFLTNATLLGAALVFVALSGTAWPYALNVGL